MSVGVVRVVGIIVRTFARPAAGHHRRRRMTIHTGHVAHGGRVGAGVAGRSRPIRLVNHGLDDAAARVDEPVVDLQDAEPRVLRQLLLLILAGVRVGQVLEQPGAQNVGRHLGEDAALFAVLVLARRVVVVAAGAVGRADAGVARVPGLREVVPAADG